MKRRKCYKRLIVTGSILIILTAFLYWQNNGLVTTRQQYINDKVPMEFDGYVITQISDLHNKEFGRSQKRLLNAIAKTKPDIIVVTGDLVDSKKLDASIIMKFIEGANKIAPVYFVSGNHELWSGIYSELEAQFTNAGVTLLDNLNTSLSIGDESITLLGLADPDLQSDFINTDTQGKIKEQLDALITDNTLNILLSHRPELMDIYSDKNIDLVFCGHSHGGQIRIPFICGLLSPDQGWLPEYTSGSYLVDQTTMIVSRGLGNSVFPQRLFNRPEIVTVTLKIK